MKRLFTLLLIVFSFVRCDDKNSSSCATNATVKDLTGLDGCGFVFELEDGSRLEPLILETLVADPNDPLYGFEFADGKRVKITYEELDNASACMAGQVVKITCLQQIGSLEN